MSKEIEEGLNLQLDFTKLKKIAQCSEDVIPAIAQCAISGDVLIVGYVNQLALETAVKEWQHSGVHRATNSGLKAKQVATISKLSISL